MKYTLKLVGISHARSGDCGWAHRLGPIILVFIDYDLGVEFQATVFCRFLEVVAKDRLEKCYEGSYKEGEHE